MASYIRPTSPDIFNPILVNPPIQQLAEIAQRKQYIYNGAVNALAGQVQDYLGLEKNAFYDFNKSRIAEFNKKAAQQLDKIGTADFSLQENMNAASSIFRPLLKDPYIQKDIQMQGQFAQGMKAFEGFKAADDKAAKEGKFSQTYSNENFLYWQRQVNRAKKASPNDIDLYNIEAPTPYIDVRSKLMKLAKDMDVKVIQSGLSPEGYFIETITNGAVGRVPIMQFFSSALNENDWRQLDINADNRKYAAVQAHMQESKMMGVPLDEKLAEQQVGEQLYQKFVPHMEQQYNFHDTQYREIKQRVDKYDPLAKHTDAEAKLYMNDQQLLEYHKNQKDVYDEYINRTPVKSIAGWRMFSENYKSSQIENIAYTYADATSANKIEANPFKLEEVKAKYDLLKEANKKEKEEKKAGPPLLVPIGEGATIPQETGKSYDHFVDYYKSQLDSRVKISNDYFDIINETDVFSKLEKIAEVDGKGNAIRIGETGLSTTQINKINDILAKEGFKVGDTKLNSVSFVKQQLRKYQDTQTEKARRDPSFLGNSNKEQREYLKKIIQLDSNIQKLDEAQKMAWETALVGKGLGGDFASVVKDRSGDQTKLDIGDYVNKDGTLISKEEFVKKALGEVEYKNIEALKAESRQIGTSLTPNYVPNAPNRLAAIQGKIAFIENKWRKIYDDNINLVRTRLNNFYNDYYEKNGIKPQTYQIGPNATKEDEALRNTILQRAAQALQGGAAQDHWAGNFDDIADLQQMVGVLANATSSEIGSITTEEYGGGNNYTRIRLTTEALNKLKKDNVGGKGISQKLLEEINQYGIRVKNIQTPLSENTVGRSFVDLMLEANQPVKYDLSFSEEFPFKAVVKYQKRLGEDRGDYKIQIETIVPDLNPDGTIKLNEKGGVVFKKGTVDDVQEAALPVETVGTANYILPTIAAELVNKRNFYAWANSGNYLKRAASIKNFSDLVRVYNELYPDAQVTFDNISNSSTPIPTR